jgi:hypothetical protein
LKKKDEGKGGAPAGGPPADVAQLVEHFTRNEGVPGSSPGVGFRRLAGIFQPQQRFLGSSWCPIRCPYVGKEAEIAPTRTVSSR